MIPENGFSRSLLSPIYFQSFTARLKVVPWCKTEFFRSLLALLRPRDPQPTREPPESHLDTKQCVVAGCAQASHRIRTGVTRRRQNSLTSAPAVPTFDDMEVHFSADLQTKLSRLASEQGRDSESLVQEAVERMVNGWFLAEGENGLAQIESGQTVSHEEVGRRMDKYFTKEQSPA
jgi:predicted transcriptional regulator